MRQVRDEPALDVLGAVSPVLSRVPSALLGRAVASGVPHPLLSASNFHGLTSEVYAAGARVDRIYVFAPLPAVSMLAALCSHADTCCIGINCDGAVFEDTELLWKCMREGLDEVLDLARRGPKTRQRQPRARSRAGNQDRSGHAGR